MKSVGIGVRALSRICFLIACVVLAPPLEARRYLRVPSHGAIRISRFQRSFVEDRAFCGDGKALAYRFQGERAFLATGADHPVADIFLTEYLAHASPARPTIFVFNGGPGAASAYLNLGLLGPLIVRLPGDPAAPFAPPYALESNAASPLAYADLVFIDPVGTGYSRLMDRRAGAFVWSSAGDAAYIADVIRAWLAASGKGADPFYIVGESYGAERAVTVADRLTCGVSIRGCKPLIPAGLLLLSQSIAMVNTTQRQGNVQGYAIGLPTIAALAWYHRRVDPQGASLERWVHKAQDFATREYLPTLYGGAASPPGKIADVVAGLRRLTGLDDEFFSANGLALTKDAYRFTGIPGQVLSASDGRFLAPRPRSGEAPDAFEAEADPVFDWGARQIYPASAVRGAAAYVLRSDDIGAGWSYGAKLSYTSEYDFPGMLDRMLRRHPGMRLIVAGGLYDTKASYGGDMFLLNHLGTHPGQIASAHYPGGHMFYSDPQSRERFLNRVRNLVNGPILQAGER